MEYADWQKILQKGAMALGLDLTPAQSRCFYEHMREMRHWNRRINLTAITDPEAIAVKHFLDAIAPADRIPDRIRLLDIGSGAGFPGLPLKVMRPRSQVTLVDSARKRVNFLRHVIRRLALDRVEVYHGRIEAFTENHRRDARFDVIVSRAFTRATDIARTMMPMLQGGATLMLWKGPDVHDEHRDLQMLSASLKAPLAIDVFPYRLPLVNAGRHLITVRLAEPGASR